MVQVNNYTHESDTLFGFGYLTSVGSYAGEYTEEAYNALDIDGDLGETDWCDIMKNDKGELFAVYGDSEATQHGCFYFLKITDGLKGDGELIESIGREVARYNAYYQNPKCDSVDYSIRFIKIGEQMFVYNTRDKEAYISTEDELNEAKEEYSEEEGYWD